jgi:hypothetical protein
MIIGPGGDFLTLDAWTEAMSGYAGSAAALCRRGANLGIFAPSPSALITEWIVQPETDADKHHGVHGQGAYLNYVNIWGVQVNTTVEDMEITNVFRSDVYPCDYSGSATFSRNLWNGGLTADYTGGSNEQSVNLYNNIFMPEGGAFAVAPIYFHCKNDVGSGSSGYLDAVLLNNTFIGRRTGLAVGEPLIKLYQEGDGRVWPMLANNLVLDLTPGDAMPYEGIGGLDCGSCASNSDNADAGYEMPGDGRLAVNPVAEMLDFGAGTSARLGALASSRNTGADESWAFQDDAFGVSRPQETYWSRGALEFTLPSEVMTMGVKLGWEGKLYYCTAGIGGTPVWVEIKNVRDVTGPGDRSAVDVTTRASNGVKLEVGGQLDGGIEFEMVYDPSDVAMLALQTAFQTNVPIGMAWMDGPIATAGSKGLWADMAVLSFKREEPLDKEMVVKVKVSPTLTANPPIWKTIGS